MPAPKTVAAHAAPHWPTPATVALRPVKPRPPQSSGARRLQAKPRRWDHWDGSGAVPGPGEGPRPRFRSLNKPTPAVAVRRMQSRSLDIASGITPARWLAPTGRYA